MTTTNPPAARAGSHPVGDLDLNRIGYGAIQVAGPGVLGLPRDRAATVEVLRTAVELSANHIAFPYGDDVHIVAKVGVVRDDQGGWLPGNSPESLRAQVQDNLHRLGLDVLDVVNFRTIGATPMAVAQSWLLQHSPNILLIPGTSSVDHLRENIAGAALILPADAVAELDAI